jgi:hypothetical protein
LAGGAAEDLEDVLRARIGEGERRGELGGLEEDEVHGKLK